MDKEFDLFENFRYNITVLRASKCLSASDLSLQLGFNISRIGNFEAKTLHNPKVEELAAIAKFFDVSMDDLIHKKVTVKFTPNG